MPRQRRVQYESANEEDPELVVLELFRMMVSTYLRNNFFELTKKIEQKLECPICLEEICCKNCFSLLKCGHYFHTNCIFNIHQPVCPVCRT